MTNGKVDILEERMKNLIKTNSDDHKVILEQIKCINEKLDQAFVTKIEFAPVKNVVWGLLGTIGTVLIGYAVKVILSHTF